MTESLPPHERYVAKLFPGSSHAWALARISDWGTHERILDVGVGSGVLGSELKNRGFSDLTGIEIDEETRQKALNSGYYRYVGASLQDPQVGTGIGNPYFSRALLLDVLEHVAKPEVLLGDVAGLLCGGGTILISVPNVTHWSLRLMLLFGYFRYAERGPLDKTHLRFFSKRVLSELIENQSNLELGEIVGSVVPLELVLPSWIARSKIFSYFTGLRIRLAAEFPSLFGYQLLVEVKKKV